jgi:PhoH-like ATPase
MTKKAYVLDTNVLIHDPQSIFQFQDNDIYIPIYVIEELDKLKSEPSIRGKNSRESCRILDELRCKGNLALGVDLNDDGGKLTVFVPSERKSIAVGLDAKSMDNVILQCALELRDKITEMRTILVTMDVNLRIRSECLGLQTAPYESQSVNPDQLSTGIIEMAVEAGDIDHMYANKSIGIDDPNIFANACIMLKEPTGKTALGRYHKSKKEIRPLIANMDVMGIRPKNREQQFALDLLLDDSVKLVTILGIAGCGKTLLATAAGLSMVLRGIYTRILISRPVVPMGKDIGYLPGTLDEKMDPWMQPIYDNLELLMMSAGKKKIGTTSEELFKNDLLRVEPLTYIRGRSLPHQFIIIDEAQNLSALEIKTIITRCGEGTKIVLTGDISQIDSPYMNAASCGLSIAVEKLHDHDMVGHLTLSKGERSELANLAAEVL